ncbi:FixH family protein [Oxalobacteraceae bacterium]|nr:FixH family protein [Oxalobacteraceae bacterium]
MTQTISRRFAPPAVPWWRQRWPWLLMLGPFLVLLAGGYTGWLAFSSQDALVVGDYYRQGKAINQDLRRDRVATTLGLSMVLGYDARTGRLAGRIGAAAGVPAGRLLLHLAHATQPEKDVQLVLLPDADGRFTAALPLLERSRWVVLAENEQRNWRLAGTWHWPLQRELRLVADVP